MCGGYWIFIQGTCYLYTRNKGVIKGIAVFPLGKPPILELGSPWGCVLPSACALVGCLLGEGEESLCSLGDLVACSFLPFGCVGKISWRNYYMQYHKVSM